MIDDSPASQTRSGASGRPSFDELIDESGGLLYALALRFCGDATQAEDLVQEVYLQAFRAWDGFEGRSNPKTWLYTIAARACQRMHRRRVGEPDRMESTDELLPFGEPLIAVLPGNGELPEREIILKETRQRMEEAIVQLPEDFRIPLILKEIVGFSVREVAQILGLEEATVRTRVHRARLKLRKIIDQALPRATDPAPPFAYSEQTCLDLLQAKQEALDRGVPFDEAVLCDRCRAVFATLDMTHEVCQSLAHGSMPEQLRQRISNQLVSDAGETPGKPSENEV